jgi:hypothetical protein
MLPVFSLLAEDIAPPDRTVNVDKPAGSCSSDIMTALQRVHALLLLQTTFYYFEDALVDA